MEKLVALLNEYDEAMEWTYEDWVLDCKLHLYEYMAFEWICSSYYWFIDWLIQEDKVKDFDLVLKNSEGDFYSKYQSLLMLCSIEDKPISFLIEVLK